MPPELSDDGQERDESETTSVADEARGPVVLVCPGCRQSIDETEFNALASAAFGVPRCVADGLAYVDASEIDEARPDPLLGRLVAGRFTILGTLGTGAMGTVYRARQEVIDRDVALKILRPERVGDASAQARFEREARATSALVSPHTVTVFDFGAAEDGSWFLAMELLRGETLGARLRRAGRLPPRQACRVAREALKSLAEAHTKGIIHRDLKPDNLFMVTIPNEAGSLVGESCKVLDFGIAKLMHRTPSLDQLETQAGAVFGTPRYMSPEQAQGLVLDARSDLYSLSVMLYAMLTGRAPFTEDDAVVVMASHITRTPPSFAEAAPDLEPLPALESLVRRGLAKHPAERPQTAEAYIALLDEAAAELAMPPAQRRRHARGYAAVAAFSSFSPRGWKPIVVGLGLSTGLIGAAVALQSSVVSSQYRGTLRPALLGLADRVRSAAQRVDQAAAGDALEARLGDEAESSLPRPVKSRQPVPDGSGLRRVRGDRYGRFE